MHLRRTEPGVDRRARVALVTEQQQRAEQVVEPAAARADHEDAGGLERDRGIERELEVGRILGGGMALDPGPGGLGGGEPGRGDRVEVADRDVDVRPSASARSMPPSAAITSAPGGSVGQAALEGCPPATTTMVSCCTRIPPLALPRSGSAGRRRGSRPLSPVVPELPVSLRHLA